MSYTPPPYLLPLSTLTSLPDSHVKAIQEVETQFNLPTAKLQEITDKMLWEFGKGLGELPDEKTKDTFMYVSHSRRRRSGERVTCSVAPRQLAPLCIT